MTVSVLFLFISAAYIASAVPVLNEEPLNRAPYPRFIQFPDGEGVLHDVDLDAAPDMSLFTSRDASNDNVYLLFTRRNPSVAQTLVINNANSIISSNFNSHVPTMVVAHGWLSNQNTGHNPTIRDAYLEQADVNIIILDWRRVASSAYQTSVRGVPIVGRGLGQFLLFLNEVTGTPFDSMHLVGFSLGAHVVGNAGRTVGGRVARVTGLDPAGPLWRYNSNALNANDGIYVEAIHTDGGYTVGGLGIGRAIAQVDFFPNGGISQPGCLTNVCNHGRAWEFFAATIRYNHLIGNRCNSDLQISLNRCRGDQLHMGNSYLGKRGSGKFRVNTSRRYPF